MSEISPKKMGITVDHGDFLLVRPRRNYRTTSNVIILKGSQPVLIDTGLPFDPGIGRIRRALLEHRLRPASVGTILITHGHMDHVHNLFNLQELCPNAITFCHEREREKVVHPDHLGRVLETAFELMGRQWTHRFLRLVTTPALKLAYRRLDLRQRVDRTFNLDLLEGPFTLERCPQIRAGELTLRSIPTPGHSAGHTCYLDDRGNLYLGDFVPFTPWVTPLAEALDDMIRSIERLLALPLDRVSQAVRAHGDIRRPSWEVSPWAGPAGERARFQLFVDTIRKTLASLPTLLDGGPADTPALTARLMPQFERYSWFLRRFSLPPAVTWTIAYCLKLEKSHVLVRQRRGKRILWARA